MLLHLNIPSKPSNLLLKIHKSLKVFLTIFELLFFNSSFLKYFLFEIYLHNHLLLNCPKLYIEILKNLSILPIFIFHAFKNGESGFYGFSKFQDISKNGAFNTNYQNRPLTFAKNNFALIFFINTKTGIYWSFKSRNFSIALVIDKFSVIITKCLLHVCERKWNY